MNIDSPAKNIVYKAMKENDEIESLIFDNSYKNMHDSIRKQIGLNQKDAFFFDCTGGGRCFKNDFQGNINPELSKIIRKFEKK